ncbi:hypothetical protein RVS70_05380 [Virgibacillus sp. M23]|uniref:hypothetical protein n=1 Tax=Virgibacillus sp. M23 TaxID=3079030 RepID=UPI002A90FCE0|nr:hypothetical protein [Virgibacillus sp. M23]MDY7043633.1 hypothetical protein [Virgibacillus sp. M23]
MNKHYNLHWIPTGWSQNKGVPHSVKFDTLEDIKKVMSGCFYTNEWVTDNLGNNIEMDWQSICPERRH